MKPQLLPAQLRDEAPAWTQTVVAFLAEKERCSGSRRTVEGWGRLDAEERVAREPVETRRLTPPEIVDYTRSLPRLWTDSGPDGRQALVNAIFARHEVLGFQRLEYESRRTRSTSASTLPCRRPSSSKARSAGYGRGERGSASLTQRSLSFLMVNATPREPPVPLELVRSA